MNLGKYIHSLLKRQAEVHVHGLGSFKRIYSPATFDQEKNLFLPPVSYIEFDSLSKEGFDFVSYFQQINQLGRSEAERLVQEEVSSIRAELELSGEVNLDGLGQLVSYGNAAIFKPYDLSGFNFEPVETAIPHGQKEEKTSETVEIDHSDPVTPEALTPVRIEEDPQVIETENAKTSIVEELRSDEELEREEETKSRSSLYVMIAVLALLALGGVYYFTQYQNKAPQMKEAVLPPDTIQTYEPAESLVDSNMYTIDTLATGLNETPEMAEMEEETNVVTDFDESKKFTIVIGTHRTLAKAYEEAEAFNKDGHQSVRVVTPNLAKNLKRVIWDTYGTKAERDSALQYVRKHIKTDAWPDMLK